MLIGKVNLRLNMGKSGYSEIILKYFTCDLVKGWSVLEFVRI